MLKRIVHDVHVRNAVLLCDESASYVGLKGSPSRPAAMVKLSLYPKKTTVSFAASKKVV